jgi:hypothetical protein
MSHIRCSCSQGMEAPTIRDTLMGVYHCPTCGKDYSGHLNTAEALLELLDRVEAIEAKTLKDKD